MSHQESAMTEQTARLRALAEKIRAREHDFAETMVWACQSDARWHAAEFREWADELETVISTLQGEGERPESGVETVDCGSQNQLCLSEDYGFGVCARHAESSVSGATPARAEPDAAGLLHDRVHPASGRLTASTPVALARAEGSITTLGKCHVLIGEVRRCIADDNLMAAHRKLDALDREVAALFDGGQRNG